MKILVIYAHPNPNSFNHAVLEELTRGLQEAGHTVKVNDLYANNFDPKFNHGDFAQFMEGDLPQEVQAEQEKVKQADALVFIYPVWWWGFPAIMKGWIDRIFSMGFAYKFGEKGPEGILHHKKALFINTTLGSKEAYEPSGLKDAMNKIGSQDMNFVGIQNVEHVFFYAVANVPDEVRKGYLEEAYRLGKEF
jgi:NAD(P)H dehydrogenase (quinone)